MRWWLVTVAVLLSVAARAETPDYGLGDVQVSDAEKAEDMKYGGYPNNKFFNNETKCRSVVSLFTDPKMKPEDPRMKAFLSYSRMKLVELDIAVSVIHHTEHAVEAIGLQTWKALPALYPTFCRRNPSETLEHATGAVYDAARIQAGLPPAFH